MNWRKVKDRLAARSMLVVIAFANSIAFLIALGLFIKSRPVLAKESIVDLIFSSTWAPLRGEFGFFPFIVGTIEVTLIAMVLTIPVCLLSAIYLSEYAHRLVREGVRLVVDIMAGIPSVLYGLWGILVIVPFVRNLGHALGHATTGYSLLSGGIILGMMVSPIIISVSLEVLRSVPMEAREATLALGTTRWETVKHVVLRVARHGILSATVLGFTRAFGETIAVLMIVGNVPKVPQSIFDPAYPLPALLANNYGEMMSIPMYESALLFSAFILLLVVSGFNLAAHITLLRTERG